MENLSRTFKLRHLGIAISLALAACGGGSGGGSSTAGSSFSGAVVDAPIANAQVSITINAPLGKPGAQIVGSISADAQGNYTVSVNLPNSAVPVFANASDPNNPSTILSSFLGLSSQLLTAGTLSSNQLPDLDITQVTTAALALYGAENAGNYAALTPAVYASLLSGHREDILPLAASIQAVVDGHCNMPAGIAHSDDLVAVIIKASVPLGGASGVLAAISSTMGAACQASLQTLMQEIAANRIWAPQMESNDLATSSLIPAGTYDLQGVIALMNSEHISSTTPLPPPEVFHDVQVTVNGNGQITSADNMVSGQIEGHEVQLNLTDANGLSYTIGGHLGTLPTQDVSGGISYSLRSGGALNSSSQPARFDAVLVPVGTTPLWTGVGTAVSNVGVACSQGFGMRMMTMGPQIGGISAGVCVLPSSTGLTLTPVGTLSSSEDSMISLNSSTLASSTLFPSLNFSEVLANGATVSTTPFILSAQASLTTPAGSGSGVAYYVMGADDVLFQVSNSVLTLNGSLLLSSRGMGELVDN